MFPSQSCSWSDADGLDCSEESSVDTYENVVGGEDGNGDVVNNLASVAELDDLDMVAGVDEDTDDVEINGDDDDCTNADDADVVSDGGFCSDCVLDTDADDIVPDDLSDIGDITVEDDRDADDVKRGGDVDSESSDSFDDADNDVCTSSNDCTDNCVDSDVMVKADSDSDVDVEAAGVDVFIFTKTDNDGKLKTAEADDPRIVLDDDWDPIKGTDFDAALEGNGDAETDDGEFFDSSGNEVDRTAEDFDTDDDNSFGNEVEEAVLSRDDEDFSDADADFDK